MTPEQLAHHAMNAMAPGLYFVDKERRIMLWNKKAEDITGYKSAEVVGRFCHSNLLCHIDDSATPLCLTSCPVHATINDGKPREAQVYLRHKEGHRIAVTVQSSAVYEDGDMLGVVETFYQPDDKKYNEDLVNSLTKLVMTDKLTGLFNRRHAEHMLERRLQELTFSPHPIGLIFADLDNFSDTNNQFGHEVGDLVLRTVADNISSFMRQGDLFARWGGEEFVGIIELDSTDDLYKIADKLRQVVERTVIISSQGLVQITVSMGATILQPLDTVKSAMSRVDQLMYQSKQQGRNLVTLDPYIQKEA